MPVSTRRVRPSGPKPAAIAFVGEGPGRDEDAALRAFVGPSGKVLWAMAKDYAGIERESVYVTNLSPYRMTDDRGKDRPPTAEEAAELTPALRAELREVDPELIVTLGRWSTAAVLGRPVVMDVVNGVAYRSTRRTLIPCVHPAAGLHQPQMLADTAYGLQAVGKWLRGEEVLSPVDEYPEPHYSRPHYSDTRFCFRPYDSIAIDTEGPKHAPWSLQFSVEPGSATIIRADDERFIAEFTDALQRDRPTVIFHHALHDLAALKAMGIDILAMGLPFRDTMIELFLRQTDPQGLKESAARLCGMEMRTYEDVVGPVAEAFARRYLEAAVAEPPGEWAIAEGRKHSILRRLDGLLHPRPTKGEARTIRQKWADEEAWGAIRKEVERVNGPMPEPQMDDIPQEEFIPYACRDADATLRQSRITGPSMDALGLRAIHKVDHDALPLIARMQEVGMLVDVEKLDALRDYIHDERTAITEVIRALVEDEAFNPASGDQVAAYCVRKGLPLEKMTKGGKRVQVDENALYPVRFMDDAIEPLLYFRELDKLEGTYVGPLYGFLKGEGRFRTLYANLYLTNAITGRLAASDPNLLAFPKRTELGRRIRGVFVARPGCVLWSCDLSQIELRVGAGLAQERNMIEAFAAGADLHTRTAARLFGKPESAIDDMTERYPCKTANFSIFYGAREHRLHAEFLKAGIPGFDIERCAEFVEEWFSLYPDVERWQRELMAQGARDGYITTDAGRRRYVPALRFDPGMGYPFNRLREKVEREGGNFPVQGTAGEIIKRSAPEVKRICDRMAAAPMLMIHDEFMGECFVENAHQVGEELKRAMTQESPWRGVPLKASWKTGPTWAELV